VVELKSELWQEDFAKLQFLLRLFHALLSRM
jgi:hypothetical protein